MKKIIAFLTSRKQQVSQKDIVDFMMSEKTIDRAAKGSMQKRLALLKRVEANH